MAFPYHIVVIALVGTILGIVLIFATVRKIQGRRSGNEAVGLAVLTTDAATPPAGSPQQVPSGLVNIPQSAEAKRAEEFRRRSERARRPSIELSERMFENDTRNTETTSATGDELYIYQQRRDGTDNCNNNGSRPSGFGPSRLVTVFDAEEQGNAPVEHSFV